MKKEIFDQVKKLLCQNCEGIDITSINEATFLCENGLLFNSLELLSLYIIIEDHFHIQFDPDDYVRLKTIGDIVNKIEKIIERPNKNR